MSQIIKNGSTISLADVESVESKLPFEIITNPNRDVKFIF